VDESGRSSQSSHSFHPVVACARAQRSSTGMVTHGLSPQHFCAEQVRQIRARAFATSRQAGGRDGCRPCFDGRATRPSLPSNSPTAHYHHHRPLLRTAVSRRPVQRAYRRRPDFCDPPFFCRRRPPVRRRRQQQTPPAVRPSRLHIPRLQLAAHTHTHPLAHTHTLSAHPYRIVCVRAHLDPTTHLSAAARPQHPADTASRQAAPFLPSTTKPEPHTQASSRAHSIEQKAILHTAAATSVHLAAPHLGQTTPSPSMTT